MTASMTGCLARRRRTGFTLVEATISIVVVATMLVSALYTFGSVARERQVVQRAHQGAGLADQLLGEILRTQFVDPGASPVFGPEPSEVGGSRAAFDDVDDFHGRSESPPQMPDGTAIAGLTGWRRAVQVENVNPDSFVSAGATDTGLKKITITVTDPQGRATVRTGFRSRFSAFDQGGTVVQAYPAWIGVALQMGPAPETRAYAGTQTMNLLP